MTHTKRKMILLILAFISWSGINCLGQDGLDELVNRIKTERDRIDNNSKTFRVTEKNINELTSEGGILKKFYSDKNLRKAELTFFGETGRSVSEYYFLNGELIFVHELLEMYKNPIYMGKVEVASRDKNDFYFKDQILVRWIENENKMVDQLQYLEKQIEFMDDLKIINDDKKDK